MNRVHEQCPKIDSGTVLSQTGSKQAECTKCTAHGPAARPGRSWPRARLRCACTCCRALRACLHAPAPAQRPPSGRSRLLCAPLPGPCEPAAPLPRPCRAPAAPLPRPCRALVAPLPRPARPPAPAACAFSLYCDTNCLLKALFFTIHQSVLQYSAHQPSTRSQYSELYCDTVSALSFAIQTSVLQYTSSLAFSCLQYNNCISIQFSVYPMLQYNFQPAIHFLYCNTLLFTVKIQYILLQYKFFFFHNIIWVVAQKHFFFFSIISNYWTITKKYTYFFFHFP